MMKLSGLDPSGNSPPGHRIDSTGLPMSYRRSGPCFTDSVLAGRSLHRLGLSIAADLDPDPSEVVVAVEVALVLQVAEEAPHRRADHPARGAERDRPEDDAADGEFDRRGRVLPRAVAVLAREVDDPELPEVDVEAVAHAHRNAPEDHKLPNDRRSARAPGPATDRPNTAPAEPPSVTETEPQFRDALRAGLALYADGEYRAAHDPWEAVWLGLDADASPVDEPLLHGLIQFTAAVHHARERNWSGATGLARSAGDYLADLPADARGLDLDAVRSYLRALERDPERVERGPPPTLTHVGRSVTYADLTVEEAALAAEALAEGSGFSEVAGAVVADAARYAREERGTGRSTFATLLFDLLAGDPSRAFVFERLERHVTERRRKEEDVEGLFE